MSVTYVFQPGGTNELTLDESHLVSHNPVLTHTGKGDLRATFEERRDLEQFASKERLNVKLDGVTKWTGFVVGVSHNQKRATTTVRADGIALRLEETRPDYDSLGGPVTYTSIALHDAIRDYWGRTPFSATVTDQTTTVVADDEPIQSADTTTEWSNVTSLASDDPVAAQNGNLELLRSNWIAEAESFATPTGSSASNADQFSDGAYTIFTSSSDSGGTLSFTTDYDIPADELEIWYRNDGGSSGTGPGEIDWFLDGNSIGETNTGLSLGWNEVFADNLKSVSAPKLSAGSHTVSFEAGNDGTWDSNRKVDLVAPLDSLKRFTGGSDATSAYFFDNDNGGSGGYLDGPELYPGSLDVELDSNKTAYNIESSTITTTWNDTSNNQALGFSNDGGSTYTTKNNTASGTVDFSSAGRTARTRFTMSRYGSRTTATPQTGFNGQLIKDYSLTSDLNDLVVIDSLDLTRNHFDNLKTLHEYGDFLWVIEHGDSSIGNLTVSSFQRGDETRTAPSEWDVPVNERPEVAAESYFNSIYLEGALDDQGNRPSAEVSDQTAINNDGRKISPGVLRDPSITTEAGAVFRANALLQTALQNNDLVGSLEAPPTDLIPPGYARGVDFDNDGTKEEKTVEEVSLSQSNGELREVVQFVVRDDFARDINELRRNAKDLGNQV